MSKRQPRDPGGIKRRAIVAVVDTEVHTRLAKMAEAEGITISNHVARLLSAGIAPAPVGKQPRIAKRGAGPTREVFHTSVRPDHAARIRAMAFARGISASGIIAELLEGALQ